MTSGHYCDGCAQAYYKCVCDEPVEQKKTPAEQSDQIPNDSPTAGMTLEERIKHVGGRKNAAGYIEFGSVMAIDALIRHVLRDLPAEPQEKSPEQTDHSAVHLHHCNIGEYEGSCKYGDENCPAMAHAALKAKWAPVREPVVDTEFQVALLKELVDVKLSLTATENQLATAKNMLGRMEKEYFSREPLGFISQKQIPRIVDPEDQFGVYIPMRKNPAGNFDTPIFSNPPVAQPKNITVHGWVWKDKQTEDDCYIPSYTPAQHVPKGELLALVDPADLHEPLQNTKWF